MNLPFKKVLLLVLLMLGLSANASASLITYNMSFDGGSRTSWIKGSGIIVADTELDAIVKFGMKSSFSLLPEYEVDFLWSGVSLLSSDERYYGADIVQGSYFSALNSANGLPLGVDNEFLIRGVTGAPYANRLDQNWMGEFWTYLYFGPNKTDHNYVNLRITKVPESSSLILFLIGLFGVLVARKLKAI